MKAQKSWLLKNVVSADVDTTTTPAYVTISKTNQEFRVKKSDIKFITHIPYTAEVQQVYTVGAIYTPTPSTNYNIMIGNPNIKNSLTNGNLTDFTVMSLASLTSMGSTVALQREWINLKLVALINAQSQNLKIVAASLGGGNGITLTDMGGYFGARQANGTFGYGANQVKLATNDDGSGFSDSVDKVLTTAAVYSFGVGATLAADVSQFDAVFGYYPNGTPQGEATYTVLAPKAFDGSYAVAGQQYDGWLITFRQEEASATHDDGHYGFKDYQVWLFANNADAGFAAFSTAMGTFMSSL